VLPHPTLSALAAWRLALAAHPHGCGEPHGLRLLVAAPCRRYCNPPSPCFPTRHCCIPGARMCRASPTCCILDAPSGFCSRQPCVAWSTAGPHLLLAYPLPEFAKGGHTCSCSRNSESPRPFQYPKLALLQSW